MGPKGRGASHRATSGAQKKDDTRTREAPRGADRERQETIPVQKPQDISQPRKLTAGGAGRRAPTTRPGPLAGQASQGAVLNAQKVGTGGAEGQGHYHCGPSGPGGGAVLEVAEGHGRPEGAPRTNLDYAELLAGAATSLDGSRLLTSGDVAGTWSGMWTLGSTDAQAGEGQENEDLLHMDTTALEAALQHVPVHVILQLSEAKAAPFMWSFPQALAERTPSQGVSSGGAGDQKVVPWWEKAELIFNSNDCWENEYSTGLSGAGEQVQGERSRTWEEGIVTDNSTSDPSGWGHGVCPTKNLSADDAVQSPSVEVAQDTKKPAQAFSAMEHQHTSPTIENRVAGEPTGSAMDWTGTAGLAQDSSAERNAKALASLEDELDSLLDLRDSEFLPETKGQDLQPTKEATPKLDDFDEWLDSVA